MKKCLLALVFCALASAANAATCFWVGGTGSWSTSNGVSWASSSGGTASTCAATGGVPKQAGDVATFDGSSGGGTVTVDSTMNGATINSIIMGAFTGTLDFSVNNPSMTLGGSAVVGISVTGTGTRTLKLGSGTFTLKTTSNNNFDATVTTNLTYDTTSTATFNITTNGTTTTTQDFIPGSILFTNNTYNCAARNDGSACRINGSTTFKAITFSTGPAPLDLPPGGTVTVTNAINWSGTSNSLIYLFSDKFPTSQATLALAPGSTLSWAVIGDVNVTGLTLPATNSYSLGNNSGITITPPSAGGGGHIIGG